MLTISDNSKLQLASSINSCCLLYHARTLLLPVPLVGKISASKLICHFSSHPAAFGFWVSSPPDNITFNTANMKTDQSLSDYQNWHWHSSPCHFRYREIYFSYQNYTC